MKLTYVATQPEMTHLYQLLLKRYRGRIAVRFTEGGVEVEVETDRRVPAASLDEAFELVSSEQRCAA